MCIIMYAPKGTTIKEDKIKTAFKNNPDGAGVMWYDRGGSVRYRKGFYKVDDLIRFFNMISPEVPRAIHCRIATSGKVSVKTCHPFPIVEKIADMGMEEGIGKRGCLMHNGIFSKYTPKDGMKCEYSDTMVFTSRVIYPIVRSNMIENSGVSELLKDMTSRVILFLPKFRVKRYGSWYKDEEEKFYASNYTYEEYSSYYGYGCYQYGYYGSDGKYHYYGSYGSGINSDPYYKKGKNVSAVTVNSTYKKENKSPITVVKPNIVTPSVTTSDSGGMLAKVAKKSDYLKPEYFFNIQLTAKDTKEAEDLLYEFLDTYYGFIVEYDDYSADSFLVPLDDKAGIWEFWVEAYEDLDKLEKIKPPFMVNYFEKYTED